MSRDSRNGTTTGGGGALGASTTSTTSTTGAAATGGFGSQSASCMPGCPSSGWAPFPELVTGLAGPGVGETPAPLAFLLVCFALDRFPRDPAAARSEIGGDPGPAAVPDRVAERPADRRTRNRAHGRVVFVQLDRTHAFDGPVGHALGGA